MDRFDLAWAAGFFDGEGWANAVAQEGRKTKQPQARINQADPNGVPEVLLRFQRAVGGLGRIGGPYVMEVATICIGGRYRAAATSSCCTTCCCHGSGKSSCVSSLWRSNVQARRRAPAARPTIGEPGPPGYTTARVPSTSSTTGLMTTTTSLTCA